MGLRKPWTMDWRFLIQNGNPSATAFDPDCAFDDGARGKGSSGLFAKPQCFVKEDYGFCIRHIAANIAEFVTRNRALLHGGQIFRLGHDSGLEDHHGVGRD